MKKRGNLHDRRGAPLGGRTAGRAWKRGGPGDGDDLKEVLKVGKKMSKSAAATANPWTGCQTPICFL